MMRLPQALWLRLACLVVAIGAASRPAGAQLRAERPPDPADIAGLQRLGDSVITAAMQREHIPGAALVVVRNSRIVLLKGYGLANVEKRQPVDPRTTIFRIGSISKVFTANAVMQLADRSALSLNEDVNRYLHRVKIPASSWGPVRVEDLLDHTSGLDEIRPGTQAPTADSVLSLADFLRTRLVRVRPPGQIISYSTYGITLAGDLVEEVSGVPFETYLRQEIWAPLGMARTNITVPPGLRESVSPGYELTNGVNEIAPWEWYHTTPASSVNSTALDMAAFIKAHVGDSATAHLVMSDRAYGDMHRQHITMHPRLPGFAIGFYEDYVGTLRVLEHGGQVAGFSSLLILIPEAQTGIFVVSHHENSHLRDDVKFALLGYLFPAARERLPVPPPPKGSAKYAVRFAGRFAPTTSCHSCKPRSVPYIVDVKANDDGSISALGNRWVPAGSLLFVSPDGTAYVSFREDESGQVSGLFAGGSYSFEKLPDQ